MVVYGACEEALWVRRLAQFTETMRRGPKSAKTVAVSY